MIVFYIRQTADFSYYISTDRNDSNYAVAAFSERSEAEEGLAYWQAD